MSMQALKTRFPGGWRAARRLMPQAVRSRLVNYSLLADRASRRAFREVLNGSGPSRISVRIRQLGDAALEIRSHTSDAVVTREVFAFQHHLPPPGVSPALIFDVGANNGASVAHLAHLFPKARVVGFEPDPGNAEIARANVSPWSNAEIVEAAVWTSSGTVHLEGPADASLHIGPNGREVRALSIDALIERFGVPDYIKFDIEGAERDIIRAGGDWAQRVGTLNIEVHKPYAIDECSDDLARLGYAPARSDHSWPIVYATRSLG